MPLLNQLVWVAFSLILWNRVQKASSTHSSFCSIDCSWKCSYQSCIGGGYSKQRVYNAISNYYNGWYTYDDLSITNVAEAQTEKIYRGMFMYEWEISQKAYQLATSYTIGGTTYYQPPSYPPPSGRRRKRFSQCITYHKLLSPFEVQDRYGQFWKVAKISSPPPISRQLFSIGLCSNEWAQCWCGSCRQIYKQVHVLVVDPAYNPPYSFKKIYLPSHCGCR